MCGVAGYARLTTLQTIEAQLLNKMHTAQAHRGPDGSGIWMSHTLGIGLSHRRLSIVDTSLAGAQPMSNDDQSVIVCFNGEIYNHRALRAELESYGHVYQSNCDTETIVYAYQQWGIDCLQRFDGMFAVVIVDAKRNELYLARDRIGIKPLYFSMMGGMLSFASEMKALWQLPWMSKQINRHAVSHYLTFLVPPAPLTLYQGIYKLPAGKFLKLDSARNVSFVQWYKLLELLPAQDFVFPDTEEQCIATIAELMHESVEKRMISDVPVGAFLSGGLDSSLIVGLMSQHTDRLKTFTVAFENSDRDERVWARKVADHFGTDHHELVIDEQQAFNFFHAMVQMQDEPIGDCVSVPIYFIAQMAKQAGVTVMLTGEGADELFCGYEMYAKYLAWNSMWQQSQRYIPAYMRRGAARMAAAYQPHIPARAALLHTWAQGQELFWGGAIVFYDAWKQEMLGRCFAYEDPIVAQLLPGIVQTEQSYAYVDYVRKEVAAHNPHASTLTHMMYRELQHRLPELLLTRLDKMTMAASIEGRVPFLDPKLVAYALKIPQHMQIKNKVTKYLLKKACQGILPDDIIYRKKVGFAAPVTQWFKKGSYFKPYFADLIHDKGKLWADVLNLNAIDKLRLANEKENVDFGYQLWVLQNLMATDLHV